MIIYDIECYPNIFTISYADEFTKPNTLEISTRKNQIVEIQSLLWRIQQSGKFMVGFNNMSYDWPVLNYIYSLQAPHMFSFQTLMDISDMQIKADRNDGVIWNPAIPQMDLLRINHYDNPARATGLKKLEFWMRMDDMQDLPFPPGQPVPESGFDLLCSYNRHDVIATRKFLLEHNLGHIKLRKWAEKQYGFECTNLSDGKLGTKLFETEIEKAQPGTLWKNRKKQQTFRPQVAISEIINRSITFKSPEFNRVLDFFYDMIIKDKKKPGNIKVDFKGMEFSFGGGGIHGAIPKKSYAARNGKVIHLQDVTSMYPSIIIKMGIYPEHIGPIFTSIYRRLKADRVNAPGESLLKATLKMALNFTYGNMGQEFSVFLDKKAMFATTINGQLMLVKLAEMLSEVPSLELIQVNTDGVAYIMDGTDENLRSVELLVKEWEQITGIDLELDEFSEFKQRDVNDYWARYTNGKVKRKGDYMTEPEAHKDPSALVIQKSVDNYFLTGESVESFILSHDDPYDFQYLVKIPRNSFLYLGEERIGTTNRVYVSKIGSTLHKHMPPNGPEGAYKRKSKLTDEYYNAILSEAGDEWDERIHTKNKSRYEWRVSDVLKGAKVTLTNKMPDTFDFDYAWYIKEAIKLVEGVE